MNKKKVKIQVDFLLSKNMFNIILLTTKGRKGRITPTHPSFLLFKTLIIQNHGAVPASVDG